MDKRVAAEVTRLRKLKSMMGKSEDEILERATQTILKGDLSATEFGTTEEKDLAEKLTYKYLEDYTLETISERNMLQEIVRLEVIQNRLHNKVNDMYNRNAEATPIQLLDALYKNNDAIAKLKTNLGLNRTRDQQKSPYDALQHLMKRAEKWREENQGSRTLKCPHPGCQKFILLKIRTDAWEAQNHPFFKDNMVFNSHLFAHRGQTVLIDDKFIADCLEFSADYVEWMEKKSKKSSEGGKNGSENNIIEASVVAKTEKTVEAIEALPSETPKGQSDISGPVQLLDGQVVEQSIPSN